MKPVEIFSTLIFLHHTITCVAIYLYLYIYKNKIQNYHTINNDQFLLTLSLYSSLANFV